MDNQTALNESTSLLMQQGCVSMSLDKCKCAYRGVNGNKCGIGHLIPDSLYHESIENNSIIVLLDGSARHVPGSVMLGIQQLFDGVDADLLGRIQSAHDSIRDDITGDRFRAILAYEVGHLAAEFHLRPYLTK